MPASAARAGALLERATAAHEALLEHRERLRRHRLLRLLPGLGDAPGFRREGRRLRAAVRRAAAARAYPAARYHQDSSSSSSASRPASAGR
jgi:hypothetical protein